MSSDGAGPPPEPVPEEDCLIPSASFAVSGTCNTFGDILADGTAVTSFNASASNAGHTGTGAAPLQTIDQYIWDFGDGTPQEIRGTPARESCLLARPSRSSGQHHAHRRDQLRFERLNQSGTFSSGCVPVALALGKTKAERNHVPLRLYALH